MGRGILARPIARPAKVGGDDRMLVSREPVNHHTWRAIERAYRLQLLIIGRARRGCFARALGWRPLSEVRN